MSQQLEGTEFFGSPRLVHLQQGLQGHTRTSNSHGTSVKWRLSIEMMKETFCSWKRSVFF